MYNLCSSYSYTPNLPSNFVTHKCSLVPSRATAWPLTNSTGLLYQLWYQNPFLLWVRSLAYDRLHYLLAMTFNSKCHQLSQFHLTDG